MSAVCRESVQRATPTAPQDDLRCEAETPWEAWQWPIVRGPAGWEPTTSPSAQRRRLFVAQMRSLAYALAPMISSAFQAPIRRYLDVVRALPEVAEVVMFRDSQGSHIWTLLHDHDYDVETHLLDAQMTLADEWPNSRLDLFFIACAQGKFEARLPREFLRLYLDPHLRA